MKDYQLNKFIEDTQALMNQPMNGGDRFENGISPVDLPSDFTMNNNNVSDVFHTYGTEDQNAEGFDTPIEDVSEVDEDQTEKPSFLNKLTSAFTGIGEAISNGTKSLCCATKYKEPVYDMVNLPSGIDTFFDQKETERSSSDHGAETMRSTMTNHTYVGVREMFETPRFNDQNSCMNPFAGCSLKMTRLVPQNTNSDNDVVKNDKPPAITYKLHAIEVHQPISQQGSKDLNMLNIRAFSGAMLQNGLEQFDPERTGLPVVTMAQIIQQHKAFLRNAN